MVCGNTGKIKEIRRYLYPMGYDLEILEGDFIEIQSETLEEVLYYGLKRYEEDHELRDPFIKDDSGLFIDALSGFPGVYSSYVQKTVGNDGILSIMDGIEGRGATFRTVVGLRIPGSGTSLFRGECKGTIATGSHGDGGFGYDPIFKPEGEDLTFAQMSTDEKNSMSHRTRAIEGLMDYLKNRPDLI